tara:strand:+ start:69 stop:668 length:600 start_codon:yes stop_codon:yes gene_type:complete
VNTNKGVVGIVLAAGYSSRMGKLKQLLPVAGVPSVVRVARVLANTVSEVAVVLGHRAKEIESALELERCKCVFNKNHSLGMLSSIQCGIKEFKNASSYLIALADQPMIQESTVSSILYNAKRSSKGIVIPRYEGRCGHPVFIDSKYYDKIVGLPHKVGLNVITRGNKDDTLEIDLSEMEIIRDMDTLDDYKRIQNLYGK